MRFHFEADRWLAIGPAPQARLRRVVVFPFAGGGASAFFAWRPVLPADTELVCLQLPGHENHLREPWPDSFSQLADQAAHRLAGWLDLPTLFFGHSMGGWLALEVIRRYEAAGMPTPRKLVVAASPAPTAPRRRAEWLHDLPEPELIAVLKRFGGTPDSVFRHRDLLDLMLPVLRADLRLFETHPISAVPPINVPVTALAGTRDPQIAPDEMRQWQAVCRGEFEYAEIDGGHFFPRIHPEQVLPWLAEAAFPG